jgi:hypothetical protein
MEEIQNKQVEIMFTQDEHVSISSQMVDTKSKTLIANKEEYAGM